ncbi:HlyD family type I secretion periplasmic adaptor subunit [Tianweitania sediminis]|uniref:Membrane fusion protein (MFP) family protein n=1 Tax=Tianweitania sediminis TaxID=1502156 RepID=A0A8J7QXD4_9HYPH|nr:HlyD family type I secretion periplasmic adaptor subunit [Tianweitania sediminis]MBP0438518.1 HlyD family type I secretion periplasmic adaptor subunit [Tianweitania sediminis]
MAERPELDFERAAPEVSGDWRKPLRAGLLVTLLCGGGFVGWAVSAPLDSAVVAPGIVAVEGSKQIVQHFEGGIIQEIHVEDGQLVQEGDLLFVLDPTPSLATLGVLTTERAIRAAQETRLMAERDRKDELVFSEQLLASTSPTVVKAIEDEQASFKRRRDLREVQENVLINKKDTLEEEILGLEAERASSEEQVTQIDRELDGLKVLLKRGLTSLTRVTTLEREKSRLEATIARSRTDVAKARRAIGEADLELAQQRADWQSTVLNELIEVRRLLAETDERIKIAKDVLDRLHIYAPRTGIAQARGPSTIGAVIRSGDTLVEIAPVDQNLVINAQIPPQNVDVINIGQAAEIRFPNFKAGESPLLYGKMIALSNDRVKDPQDPKNDYFFARIEIDKNELEKLGEDRVRAGMAAQIILPTGERTAGEYLLQPLTDRLRVAFRDR